MGLRRRGPSCGGRFTDDVITLTAASECQVCSGMRTPFTSRQTSAHGARSSCFPSSPLRLATTRYLNST